MNQHARKTVVAIRSDKGVQEMSEKQSTKRKIESNGAQYDNTHVGVNGT